MPIPIQLPKTSARKVQQLVLFGLFVRECKTRFGKGFLGLLWTLTQPITTIAIMSVNFGFILKSTIQSTVPAIPYPMFLLLGFLPLNFFDYQPGLLSSESGSPDSSESPSD